MISTTTDWVKVAQLSELKEKEPVHARVENVDLVIIRYGDKVSVLYGRCLHRGALLSDGYIQGKNLICGLHFWDYRYETGVSEYNSAEALHKFSTRIDIKQDAVYVDRQEIIAWEREHPQPYDPSHYLGQFQDIHMSEEEPYRGYINQLAEEGLSRLGPHGPLSSMGVPLQELPSWRDVQILTAQLWRKPLPEEAEVDTSLVIGPAARRPLKLKMPILISDMSFGALSEEARLALARGAELAGTGICSGEGGMLPEEPQENSRYLYELGSGKFGWNLELVKHCQAFHFKLGQAVKTGIGGHLPGDKVKGRIAQIRGLPEGKPAISPPTFPDLNTPEDFRNFADKVRAETGGIPIGIKLSAQHLERDLDFALQAGIDYLILDGRGGSTGAAPDLFKQNISLPTMVALARARRFLNKRGADKVTLIITGGLRVEADFIKALALGADGIAIATSALHAIGCQAMRACHTNNCPVGIATQKKHLRQRLNVDKSARRLANFLLSSLQLMKVMARACGYKRLKDFNINDLTTFKENIHRLTGIPFAGNPEITD